jgi:hypothetical protein
MQTMSHLALQPAVNARPMGDFEQSLAKEPLRRVEAKEFIFAEGDNVQQAQDTWPHRAAAQQSRQACRYR